MEYMTNQQVFDKVLEHSRQMTERSFNGTINRCVYRMSNGNKCFIGALIPDDKYNPNFEKMSLKIIICNTEATFINPDSLEFAIKLQMIHDNQFDDREYRLQELAKMYKLNYTPPTQN